MQILGELRDPFGAPRAGDFGSQITAPTRADSRLCSAQGLCRAAGVADYRMRNMAVVGQRLIATSSGFYQGKHRSEVEIFHV